MYIYFLYTHGIDTVDNFLCPSAGKEEKIIALMQHNWEKNALQWFIAE